MPPPFSQQRLLEQYFAQSIRRNPALPVVISEGDSWFSFPSHANTIDHLDELVDRRMSLLRLEESGDTLQRMTSGEQRGRLRQFLTTYPVDALLFSGGGNDVVGPEILDLFDDLVPGQPWESAIRPTAMDLQFQHIANAYHTIAELRDQYRPNAWIITHTYAYVRPNGKPTVFWLWPIPISLSFGPWIKTNLEARGIDQAADQTAVVRYLIDRFHDTIADVASVHERFTVIDNRSRLTQAADWTDELHPSRTGFRKVAQQFRRALRTALPAKFP